jgi:VWFA-related protein
MTVVMGLALVATLLNAQAPDPQAPMFPVRAELVVVDTVVLDAKGDPAQGLNRDDFMVKEDGQPQAIASFEAVALPESPPSPAGISSFVSTNESAPKTAIPSPSFVILFDDAQLTATSADRARAAVKRFLEIGLRDSDEVTLVSSASGVWWSAVLSEGRPDLLALLDRLKGHRVPNQSAEHISDYEATRIVASRDPDTTNLVLRRYLDLRVIPDLPASQPDLAPSPTLLLVNATQVYAEARARNQASLRALERVAEALGTGKGRKSIILVSDGFVHDPTLDGFRAVVRAARRSNSAIDFLDARGLTGSAEFEAADVGPALQERDVLATMGQAVLESEGAESLATDTGGLTVRGPANLEGGLSRAARESRSYYLIGYVPTNLKRDGKYRKIQVEVRRARLQVRARRGYYAPGSEKPTPVKEGDLEPAVRQAFDSPFALDGIPLRMAVYVLGPRSGSKADVVLAAEADPRSFGFRNLGARSQTTLDSYTVVVARDTGENNPVEKELAVDLPLPARAKLERTWLPVFRDFELAPGRYQARFLLRDRGSGRMGSVRREFDVPDGRQFGITTPILTDSLQPGSGGSPPRPVLLARRSFTQGEKLLYLFGVLGAQPDPSTGLPRVTSQYEVRRRDGSAIVRMDATAIPVGPQGHPGQRIAISLEGVAPGAYEIVLTLKDQVSGRALREEDAFVVERTSSASNP